MGRAYVCDGCDEPTRGQPALSFDIEPERREGGTGRLLWLNGVSVDYPVDDTSGDLCPDCAAGIIAAIKGVFTDD